MKGSRALDEIVADKVLGRKWEGQAPPRYSGDIAAAWEVADWVCDQGFRLQLEGKKLWQARFYKSVAHTLETQAFSASAGSPAEAICLAAMAFKGVAAPSSKY